jgi:hypothetical protein
VRTTATAGPGELTHPIVLTRIVEEVLSMGGDPLSMEQREQVAGLASRGGDEIEQVIEGMDSRPRLASTVAEVEAKLDFIEHLGEALTAGQREALDRLVAAEGAPLSPLALIEAREVDLGADAASFRRGVAAELAREFQIDPVLADALAGKLQGGLVPFFDGSALELSTPRRALMAARAHAQTLEELLRAPGLGQEARERALRAWVVTVPRPAGDRAH